MKAIITVGISGSGKTTWAEQQEGFININRDDIRFDYFCGGVRDWKLYNFKKNEKHVTETQKALIEAAAKIEADIIISDTNLKKDRNNQLKQKLESLGYEVEFKFFPCPLPEAILRDDGRSARVGPDVITMQYETLQKEYPENV